MVLWLNLRAIRCAMNFPIPIPSPSLQTFHTLSVTGREKCNSSDPPIALHVHSRSSVCKYVLASLMAKL